MDNSTNYFYHRKIPFSLIFFWAFYGQSFIKTVQGPLMNIIKGVHNYLHVNLVCIIDIVNNMFIYINNKVIWKPFDYIYCISYCSSCLPYTVYIITLSK